MLPYGPAGSEISPSSSLSLFLRPSVSGTLTLVSGPVEEVKSRQQIYFVQFASEPTYIKFNGNRKGKMSIKCVSDFRG